MELTPEEKAKEIRNKFSNQIVMANASEWSEPSKQCALIAVDEILKAIPMYTGNLNPTWKYWDDVRKEIGKL